MGYERLTIVPERGGRIVCMFNPERYTIAKTVQFAEVGIPGLDSPVVQYVRGQAEKATLDLFFDTTDEGMVDNVRDVRKETSKVFALLRVNGETHAPLRVRLEWGPDKRVICFGAKNRPWCVVESVSQEFLLFSPNGTPLRAKLALSLKEAWTVEQQLTETGRHSSDRTKLIAVQSGQTLSQIAAREYDDPGAWRIIAEWNGIEDPAELEPGTMLVIPKNTPGAEAKGGDRG